MPEGFPVMKEVGDLFQMLLGKRCKVSKGRPLTSRPADQAAVGIYADDDGKIVAAIVVDIGLAGTAGTALSMLPPGIAKDVTRTKRLPENVAENLYEVLNVSASLFNDTRSRHVRLTTMVHGRTPVPKDVAMLIRKPKTRMDMNIEVQGYPTKGRVSFMAA